MGFILFPAGILLGVLAFLVSLVALSMASSFAASYAKMAQNIFLDLQVSQTEPQASRLLLELIKKRNADTSTLSNVSQLSLLLAALSCLFLGTGVLLL